MSATDNLKHAINTNISQAIEMVLQPRNEQDAESFVYEALGNEKSTPELLEAALQGCFNLHERMGEWSHGGWVHSMSHFMENLWDQRLIEWIKKFHEVSFKGAREWGQTSCSDRLVGYFAHYARFDDDPKDFGLTLDNLEWMSWKYHEFARLRIEHGVFKSEGELKIFNLRYELQSEPFTSEDGINVSEIEAKLGELRQLGSDVSEFDGIIRQKMEQRLVRLREQIETTKGYDPKYWSDEHKAERIAEIQQTIEQTLKQLSELS